MAMRWAIIRRNSRFSRRPLPSIDCPCHFSSSSDHRLGKTLYRQLIRWCKKTDRALPLSSFVPPVTLKPPHVSAESLQKFEWNHLLPQNSQVQAHQMVIPIYNSEDAQSLFQIVFRMNLLPTKEETQKQRISIAFEALRSLNELTRTLDSLQDRRQEHLDRTGVLYHVGQVVQHKSERWRGLITGWQRIEDTEKKLSSLTKKDYSASSEDQSPTDDTDGTPDAKIQYTLILDSGDAHLLGGSRQVQDGSPIAMQSELELVTDDSLCRIRSNWTAQYFDRFDSGRFVPNAARSYEYPLDIVGESTDFDEKSMIRNEVGRDVLSGIQKLAGRLERHILDESSCSEARRMSILARFHNRLSALAQGDVVPESASLSARQVSDSDLATFSLKELLDIVLEVSELLYIRHISSEHKKNVQFSLGDIVQHKRYGFRGVVAAWDPKPAVDVSHWDGLTHIKEDVTEMPFYHILPVQSDCVEAFGGERPFRYVCQANLEACPRERSFVELEVEPGWTRREKDPGYIAPDEIKFKYAEDLDEDGVTESCLTSIMDDVTRLHLALRDGHTENDFVDIVDKLSLDKMFEMLKLSDTMESAIVVEETIKEIFKCHADKDSRTRLDKGVADLLRGKKEQALAIFAQLTKDDPDYAEAWNKAATCHFMLGDMQSSLEATERALELCPRHFQAMNGLGLIHHETRRYKLAAKAFRQSLSLDPWSPVSSRLAACLDMLHGDDLEDEGASEGTAPYE